MNRRRHASESIGRIVTALCLVLTMAVSGLLSDPASVRAMARPGEGPGGTLAWLDLGAKLSSFMPLEPLFQVMAGANAIDDGDDGRLTFLLLGSDTKTTGISRTDTIMIVSIENGTNAINAASIPRDTARILNPFTTANPTDYFSGRVNAILKQLKKGTTTAAALAKFEIVIEKLLGTPANPIEIDYHALITFNGFHALVDVVDPITVNITKTIKDSKYWDDPTKIKGVYFPVATNYQLYAWQPGAPSQLCNGLWRNHSPILVSDHCHRAMPFVRSRKGKSNSDFARARRQQNFVGATIKTVIAQGSGAALTSLLNAATGQKNAGGLHTNFPNSEAAALFTRLLNAQLAQQVVFGPTVYSTHIPGSTAYQLKLPAVRAWADANLR
ncbi:MAG: LCP family protein [Chloroflexota bacterium]